MKRIEREPESPEEKEFAKTIETSMEFVAQEFCRTIPVMENGIRGLTCKHKIDIKGKEVRIQLKIMEMPSDNELIDGFLGALTSAFEKWLKDKKEEE